MKIRKITYVEKYKIVRQCTTNVNFFSLLLFPNRSIDFKWGRRSPKKVESSIYEAQLLQFEFD